MGFVGEANTAVAHVCSLKNVTAAPGNKRLHGAFSCTYKVRACVGVNVWQGYTTAKGTTVAVRLYQVQRCSPGPRESDFEANDSYGGVVDRL